MSEASQESSESLSQIDRQLLAEARLYNVPYKAYAEMTPRMRGAVKGRWVNSLRLEAKRRGIDADAFVATDEEGRARAREENPERPKPAVRRQRDDSSESQELSQARAAARSFEDVMSRHQSEELPVAAPEQRFPRGTQVAPVYDQGLTDGDPEDDDEPHSPMNEVPPTEYDPAMRSRATLGEVRPTDNEDLAGWKQPRNLLDVYARYSVGDGQHFVRVERVEPKVWQGIPCSGYLGEIRVAITEVEFHAWYGGRVYQLTVYGPDPKGRHDPATGLPVIKAKTEPFRYTVPVLPPNLALRPGTNPSKQQHGERPMMQNPFGFPQGSAPATPADASMHKTTIDFLSNMLTNAETEKRRLREEANSAARPDKDVLSLVSGANDKALEQANLAATRREEALQEQLREAREATKRLEAKLEKEADERRQNPQRTAAQEATDLLKVVQPGKTAEEEMSRLRIAFREDMDRALAAHKEECNRIRESHKEAMAALKERQEDEMKRTKERLDDNERRARERETDLERRMREQETELRRQMEQVRSDERAAATARVQETVARFEERIKDVKEQHARELRMQGEQHATRIDNTKNTLDMQLTLAKERVTKLEEELEQAREEAETAKDPVAVIKKAEATAEAMGFKKEDNGPVTAWERFAAMSGTGLAKALETIDQWLPKAMEARAQRPALPPGPPARQLPPGAQGQDPRVIRQPSRRSVSFATQGSVPVAGHHPTIPPESPAPFAPAPPPSPPQSAPQQPVSQNQPPPQTQQPEQPPPQQQTPVPSNGQSLGGAVPDEAIAAFRAEVERSINGSFPAEIFAQQFVDAYPDPSRALVTMYKPENFIELVRAMPGGAESVILRRDGKKWVEKLWQQIAAQHQARAPQQQVTS